MALIATEDTFVTDADGIRRKIAAGGPVPAHLAAGFQEQTKLKEVAKDEVHEPAVSTAEGDNAPHPVTQERQRAAARANSRSSRSSSSSES